MSWGSVVLTIFSYYLPNHTPCDKDVRMSTAGHSLQRSNTGLSPWEADLQAIVTVTPAFESMRKPGEPKRKLRMGEARWFSQDPTATLVPHFDTMPI